MHLPIRHWPRTWKGESEAGSTGIGQMPVEEDMKKLIPEVIDLVEVLAEIAASMKPHSSEIERCKTSKTQLGSTRIRPSVALNVPPSMAPTQPVTRKEGQA